MVDQGPMVGEGRVLLSPAAAGRLPLKSVHKFAVVLFLVLGAIALGTAHA
jgi:hypothetical protein